MSSLCVQTVYTESASLMTMRTTAANASAKIDEEGTPVGTLAEAVVASFDSHPDVKWVQFATSEAKASFVVEGDTVVVQFQQVDETAWRASFEVQDCSKSPTQIVSNSVRILSGVFHAVRELRDLRQPERLTFADETLEDLYDA
jgi:hypothetical protein